MAKWKVFATVPITIAVKVEADSLDEAIEKAIENYKGLNDIENGAVQLKDPCEGYCTMMDTEDNPVKFYFAEKEIL